MGVPPPGLWELALWELNAAVKARNEHRRAESKRELALCWQTASFTGAAFGGKLKRLSHYLRDDQKQAAPQVSREEFERRLAAAKGCEETVSG